MTEFSAGITASSSPTNIVAGPDGNLWFTECSRNRIGRITPAGVVTESSIGIPTDQAWIESLNGHLKAENPHLLAIRDPATLRAELAVVRAHCSRAFRMASPRPSCSSSGVT